MGVDLDAKPCPFCGERLVHIGSWARSFEPPRLYHEWKHPPVECYLNPHGDDVPMFCSTDNPEEQILRIGLWNSRRGADVGSLPECGKIG